MATRETLGTTSFSGCSCFPTRFGGHYRQPRDVPSGAPKAGDESAAYGIIKSDMTIGIVLVACWAAWVAAPVIATMTSTFERTKSARAGYRSYWPSAHRDSIAMF